MLRDNAMSLTEMDAAQSRHVSSSRAALFQLWRTEGNSPENDAGLPVETVHRAPAEVDLAAHDWRIEIEADSFQFWE